MVANDKTKELIQACVDQREKLNPSNLFDIECLMQGRFGFDPRSAWDSLGAGYSPNEHGGESAATTYPVAELLSSIALQTFPVKYVKRGGEYQTWEEHLPISLARAAISGGLPWIRGRRFKFYIELRGQGIKSFTPSHELLT